mmetsp:Transcript_35125/g.111006  ORF Transcript_35125/g.111006 Transcript_35125/m.111006 type:complete len:320 (+) Transcript_35125:641-1600(+)
MMVSDSIWHPSRMARASTRSSTALIHPPERSSDRTSTWHRGPTGQAPAAAAREAGLMTPTRRPSSSRALRWEDWIMPSTSMLMSVVTTSRGLALFPHGCRARESVGHERATAPAVSRQASLSQVARQRLTESSVISRHAPSEMDVSVCSPHWPRDRPTSCSSTLSVTFGENSCLIPSKLRASHTPSSLVTRIHSFDTLSHARSWSTGRKLKMRCITPSGRDSKVTSVSPSGYSGTAGARGARSSSVRRRFLSREWPGRGEPAAPSGATPLHILAAWSKQLTPSLSMEPWVLLGISITTVQESPDGNGCVRENDWGYGAV